MARPTKLTPELEERIVTALRKGAYIETAAALVGISRQTLHNWLRRGSKDVADNDGEEQLYVRFRIEVEKALAESEMHDLEAMREIGEKDRAWQVFAWLFERRFPERYGRRSQAGTNPPREQDRLVVLGRMVLDEIRSQGVNPTVPVPEVRDNGSGSQPVQ